MAGNPFDGCWHRIRRARAHRNAAHRRWHTFLNEHPYSVHFYGDGEGNGSLVFEQQRRVPPSIAVDLGEYLYNLRTALDYCAYAVAIIDSDLDPPPGDDLILFPIYSDVDSFRRNRHRIDPLTEKHRQWIEAVQPYAGGDDPRASPLYWVNELARIDRHRQLHVLGGYVTRSAPVVRSSRPVSVTFDDVDPLVFVEGETEIARFHVTPFRLGDQIEANPNASLDIEIPEFARQRPVSGADWLADPLFKRLQSLITNVEGVIGIMELDCIGKTRSRFVNWIAEQKGMPGIVAPHDAPPSWTRRPNGGSPPPSPSADSPPGSP
jgi:hypothetical protein